MKKTVSVNIGGINFIIDEDAYYKLSRYLERVRAHFNHEYGGEEIVAGIESRIAEMLHERKKNHQQVVNIEDVQEVISQLGEPVEISGSDSERNERRERSDYAEEPGPKQLFRDPDNKYIGGVCSGLAAYFNIDPTWVRLLFVLLIFAAGSTILAYIILWIVIPKARTTADRLSMRGERINIFNIEKSIREDLRDIKRNLEDLSKKA